MKQQPKRRRWIYDAAVLIGFGVFVMGILAGGWLAFVSFWVHPEMTKAALFWAYWREHVVMAAGILGGGSLMEWGCDGH